MQGSEVQSRKGFKGCCERIEVVVIEDGTAAEKAAVPFCAGAGHEASGPRTGGEGGEV